MPCVDPTIIVKGPPPLSLALGIVLLESRGCVGEILLATGCTKDNGLLLLDLAISKSKRLTRLAGGVPLKALQGEQVDLTPRELGACK